MLTIPLGLCIFAWSIIGVTWHKGVVAQEANPVVEPCREERIASMYTPPSMLCEGKNPGVGKPTPPWTWTQPLVVGEVVTPVANK